MFDFLTAQPNITVAVAIYSIMLTVKKAAPGLVQHHLWARFEPIAPLAIACGMVWIPGLGAAAGLGAGDRIMLGLNIGALAAYGHKLLKQSFLGDDERIQLRQ
jgi:hypothetical protein